MTSLPLVIDPVLTSSTYLGGGGQNSVTGIAVDAPGNIFVAGWTDALNFPAVNAFHALSGGSVDAFVAKLAPGGNSLLYCTYLGGSGDDRAFAIAVDASGSAYVTGWTGSPNFPTVNPLQSNRAGGRDAFVAKLNPSGNALLYSTFLGGNGNDSGNGIAVDGGGSAYVAGDTASPNFPTASAYQSSLRGAQNAFVAKLSASGSLAYATYLGGTAAITAPASPSTLPATHMSQGAQHPLISPLLPRFSRRDPEGRTPSPSSSAPPAARSSTARIWAAAAVSPARRKAAKPSRSTQRAALTSPASPARSIFR
jgi:hypothetical protein